MTTLREAAQQALTVLDGMEQNYGNLWQVNASPEGLDALCAALRAALAEQSAEQEPVAWMSPGKERLEFSRKDTVYGSHTIPLYTAPQPAKREPLTDEEIEQAYREIWRNVPSDFGYTNSEWIEQGIKYAERAHGIGDQK